MTLLDLILIFKCFFRLTIFKMSFEMTIEVEFCVKFHGTVLATKSFVAVMDCHMLVEIGSLREAYVATGSVANVRLLIRVNSQVVEEIVPFPEHFLGALIMSAIKHSNDFLKALLGSVLEDNEVIRPWHVLLNAYLSEIVVFTMHYKNFVFFWIYLTWQLIFFLLCEIADKIKSKSLHDFHRT